jgi:hypothetical protein
METQLVRQLVILPALSGDHSNFNVKSREQQPR